MITRMAATARTIPKTDVSVPKAGASLAGSGFGAMSAPLAPDRCHQTLGGAFGRRCVSHFTLCWLSKKCMGAQGVQKIMGTRRVTCDGRHIFRGLEAWNAARAVDTEANR